MSSKEYDDDDDDEMELDDVDEELTQEDTWSVVSAFFDEFQMVRDDDDDVIKKNLNYRCSSHTLHTEDIYSLCGVSC